MPGLTAVLVVAAISYVHFSAGSAQANDPFVDPPVAQIERGKALFAKQWKADDSSTPDGDGLGPVFNARGCADCHNLGGPGGGGRLEQNVDLLTLIPPANKERIDREQFRTRLTNFHPGFTAETKGIRAAVTLHKFGTSPAYGEWRIKVLAFVEPGPMISSAHVDHTIRAATKAKAPANTLQFKLVQRNTPALFGAGAIDSIPPNVLQQTAENQPRLFPGIKGAVANASEGGIGKFGWRGQTASLKQFVMGACANELGLEVPNNRQGIDPLEPDHRAPGLDLTQEQCDDLIAYVASLPAPKQREPNDKHEKALWDSGELMFDKVGCTACHMQKLGDVAGIYSDLLLHDMGASLGDPSGTNPNGGGSSVSGAYYGGPPDAFADVPSITQRQWRTPPLWGVADSGPYLHDGRAATILDAILDHGGEANESLKAFQALPAADRFKMIAFLQSLSAPPQE